MVAFHIEAERHWLAKSWDRAQIPKPWSRVATAIGEPLYVREDADEAAIEAAITAPLARGPPLGLRRRRIRAGRAASPAEVWLYSDSDSALFAHSFFPDAENTKEAA